MNTGYLEWPTSTVSWLTVNSIQRWTPIQTRKDSRRKILVDHVSKPVSNTRIMSPYLFASEAFRSFIFGVTLVRRPLNMKRNTATRKTDRFYRRNVVLHYHCAAFPFVPIVPCICAQLSAVSRPRGGGGRLLI